MSAGPNSPDDFAHASADQFVQRVYPQLYAKAKQTVPTPGDKVSVAGLDVLVVTSAGQTIKTALPGAGQPNASCASFKPGENNAEDPLSVGIVVSFGAFRTVHLGDLTKNKEFELMCPANRIGMVKGRVRCAGARSQEPEARSQYDPPMGLGGWLFAAMYDRMSAGVEAAGLGAHREQLLRGARGRVLEIGAGTGANLPFYREGVETITLAEPEAPMARRLAHRIREQSRTAEIVQAPAERLPFADAEFDTAVSTLVLCTVPDQARALGELRRVLKPGGRLLFIEHVRSDEPRLAAWQDRLNGLNRVVGNGCNCNRTTLDAIRAAGFRITSLRRDELHKAPRFVRPLIVGTAESSVTAP